MGIRSLSAVYAHPSGRISVAAHPSWRVLLHGNFAEGALRAARRWLLPLRPCGGYVAEAARRAALAARAVPRAPARVQGRGAARVGDRFDREERCTGLPLRLQRGRRLRCGARRTVLLASGQARRSDFAVCYGAYSSLESAGETPVFAVVSGSIRMTSHVFVRATGQCSTP
jgi:hypothetical protein